MAHFHSNALIGAGGQGGAEYQIDRSLRFNDSDSAHLTRTFSQGNAKKWTWSCWVKRNKFGGYQTLFGHVSGGSGQHYIDFGSDKIRFTRYVSSNEAALETTAKYRDPSAWYHIVAVWDTENATANNRQRLYVNGVEVTDFSTRVNPSQNYAGVLNTAIEHNISKVLSQNYGAFQLAEMYFIDGQALAPTDFGEYNDEDIWQPKEFTGSYDQSAGGRTIANSTGALPILNTSGDDGETATSGVRTDSNASSIVLALPLNGSNGGTTITDYHHTVKGSGSAKAISIYTGTASGGAVTSTAVSKYYGSSFYAVRGATNNYTASDYIYRTGDSDLDLGTGSFCVEFWYYPTAFTSNCVIFDNRHQSNSWPNSANGFSIVTTGNGSIFTYSGGNQIINHSTKLTLNQWNHIAYTRDGSTERLFVNGDFFNTTASSSRNYNEGRFHLGSAANNGEGSDGYYQDLRIYKGVAKYTSNFTVPVIGIGGVNSFHLKFADNSSNAALGTDSSGLSNTWTVNNLSVSDGSAVTISTATGGLPIRNTTGDQGGTAASGFRTDSNASNLFLALPLNTNTSDVSNSINSNSTTKTTTNQSTTTSSTQSRFYGNSGYWNANTDGILVAQSGSELVLGTGDYTIECWLYDDDGHDGGGNTRNYIFDNRLGGSIVGDPPTLIGHIDSHSEFNFYDGSNAIKYTVSSTVGQWWHYAVSREGTTTRMFINGVLRGSATSSTNFTNNGIAIGRATDGGYGFAGYIQDFRVYKTAKYTSNFDIPAEASTIVAAGNDSLIDSPTNYEADSGNNGGNYATLNPITLVGRDCTFSNGNLDVVIGDGFGSTNNDGIRAVSTIGMTSGKWYFEHEITGGSLARSNVGVVNDITTYGFGGNHWVGSGAGDYIVWSHSGQAYNNGSASSYGVSWTTGDIIGCAFDADNGKMYIYKNGSVMNSGTPSHTGLTNGPYYFICAEKNSNITANFGQRPFAYTPPTGYVSLCTQNLADPTIADGSTAFDTALYTGNGSTQSITGLAFNPDLVWMKTRSQANDHVLVDSVRGVGVRLFSNDAIAENTQSTSLTSFNSDGFSLGSHSSVNQNNVTHVAWTWDAGTSNTSITAGSLNSSTYNTSRVWSSGITNPSSDFDQAATNAFNGDRSNKLRTGGNSVLVTLNFSPALTVASTIEILGEDYATADFRYTVTVDGTTTTKDVNQGQPATFNVSGSLTQITFDNNNGNGRTYLEYIKVDGKELIDSNITPPNVPTIASTVRTNQTAGFSIVSYTAPSSGTFRVGHGLNAAPGLIISKHTNRSSDWYVWHSSFDDEDDYINLNSNSAKGSAANFWGTSAPGSTTFGGTIGTSALSGDTDVAYCFAPVEGYSAFGSYTGNGSANGPFVYTGFRPAFVMVKRTNAAEQWAIGDIARDTFNPVDDYVWANASSAEDSNSVHDFDYLSNGFKVRYNHVMSNGSGDTYLYMAFAEHPFKTARAR